MYSYNWAAYVGLVYAHAYSSPEILIRHFLLLFLYFFCLIYASLICLCSSLFPDVYVSVSLSICFFVLDMLD